MSSVISIQLTSAVELGVKTAAMDFAVRLVKELASEWGISEEVVIESLRRVNLDSVFVGAGGETGGEAIRIERPMPRPRGRPGRKPKTAGASASGAGVSGTGSGDATSVVSGGSIASGSGSGSKPDVMLPFCGVVCDTWCLGIRKNYGLYSQCSNARRSDGKYCKTCAGNAMISPTGKPQFGDIHDRLAVPLMEFRDPGSNVRVLPLINVIEKHIAPKTQQSVAEVRAEMESAAAKMGWTIPAENWVLYVAKRGAPKGVKRGSKKNGSKDVDSVSGVGGAGGVSGVGGTCDDSASDLLKAVGVVSGAPKIASASAPKSVATSPATTTTATANSMGTTASTGTTGTTAMTTNWKTMTAAERAEKMAKMQAQRQGKIAGAGAGAGAGAATTKPVATMIAPTPIEIPMAEDSEDDDEIEVVKFVHMGRVYLRDEKRNTIYDVDSEEEIGIYNPTTDSIELD